MFDFDILRLVEEIAGAILASFIFIVIWEWLKRPRLRFEWLAEDRTIKEIENRQLRLFHMKVHNDGHSTAERCFLTITYRDDMLTHLITLSPGKWDDNPEPINYNPANPNAPFFDFTLMPHIGRINIR